MRASIEHHSSSFEEGQLSRRAAIRKIRMVRSEGDRDNCGAVEHHGMLAMLSAGHRARSHRGIQFRAFDQRKSATMRAIKWSLLHQSLSGAL